MKALKEQIDALEDEADICPTIVNYLQTTNPIAFRDGLAVWGSRLGEYRCQANVDGERYGHVFKIDVENETLEPI